MQKLVDKVKHKDDPGAGGERLSEKAIWEGLIGEMSGHEAFQAFELTADQWLQMLEQFAGVRGARTGTALFPEQLKDADWTAVERVVGVQRAKMQTAIALMPTPRLVGTSLRRKFPKKFRRKECRKGSKSEGEYRNLLLLSRDEEAEGEHAEDALKKTEDPAAVKNAEVTPNPRCGLMAPKRAARKDCSTKGASSVLCTSASRRTQHAQQGKSAHSKACSPSKTSTTGASQTYTCFKSAGCALKCGGRKNCRTEQEALDFRTNGGRCANPRCASATSHLSPMKSDGGGEATATQGAKTHAYRVGDLVNAPSVGGPRPAIITIIRGKDVIIFYLAKSRGLALMQHGDLTPNNEFDWCKGIALDPLQEGSAVEGRYVHGEGGKQWFQGKIAAINSNGTFAVSYDDGDYEASVRRENIRTEADKERANPQLAQSKKRGVQQSFASSLSPAHGGSASPEPKTTPAQAACQASIENEAKATGAKEAEATQKQVEESIVAETQVAVKEEPVEEHDGSYACLICGDSVRGTEALKCSHWQCQSNPIHRQCIADSGWLSQCPSCKRQTMTAWSGEIASAAAVVATIDLSTESGDWRGDAEDPEGGALQPIGEGGQDGGPGAGEKRKREEVAEGGSVDAGAQKTKRGQTDAAEAAAAAVTRAQVDVKEEPVEEYDGSYACLISGDSVRGTEALKCSHWQCQSNPLHRACITNPQWLRECPTCKRQTMTAWGGASASPAAVVATIDLMTVGGKGRGDAAGSGGSSLAADWRARAGWGNESL